MRFLRVSRSRESKTPLVVTHDQLEDEEALVAGEAHLEVGCLRPVHGVRRDVDASDEPDAKRGVLHLFSSSS